ncbi:RHS repeat-associated core domain-containing protein [Saccharobesus litoralis]|uniref:RHS repeat-associated core domain-containing protein n=1 Tax=Saccharobesus litoralis TaxID=2172099 RepID=UPI0038CD257A
MYDPWGKSTSITDSYSGLNLHDSVTFTGHETVSGLDIIHMNGRIYDPTIGRFLQADPHIQAPSNSQNYNRYSYVLNNPMSYTDPSGYFFKKLLKGVQEITGTGHILRALAGNKYLNMIAQIGLAVACGPAAPACMAAYSGAQTFAVTGSLNASIKSAGIAYATGKAFQQIGEYFNELGGDNLRSAIAGSTEKTYSFGGNLLTPGQIAGQISAHAIVGGIAAELQGGKFGHGFFSAGVTKGAGGAFLPGGANLSTSEVIQGTVISAVIGGTASVISGGKFANGAKTAAFQYLLNQAGRSANAKRLKQKRINALLQGAQDGHLTLEEAKAWYRHANGASLNVDMSKIDFGSISASDFPNGVGSSEYINTFFKDTPDGNVLGSIKLTLTSQNTVVATFGYDGYDFNINWSDGRLLRNVATAVGDTYHGSGTPFRIYLQGTGTLNP